MKPLLIAVLASAAAALSQSAAAADPQNEKTPNTAKSENITTETSQRAPANKKSEENIDVDAALKEMQTAFESMDTPDSGSSTN